MENFDTKLLAVFEELMRTRSVSVAAEHMGMSQSTMSFCLARLRELLGDPLFIRTRGGMAPTARARDIEARVAQARVAVEALLAPAAFAPGRSDRQFRLCMTDISHIVLLPRILNRLREAAPQVGIEVLRIGDDTPALMERGEADLAIGFMPQIDAGFYRQRLFEQDFVCIAGAAHPRIKKRFGPAEFGTEGHIGVSLSMSSQVLVDRAIRQAGLARKVVLRLPNYLGLAAVVAQTDLVATVPRLLGEIMARQEALKLFAPPFPVPGYAVNQYWHARCHQDPGHVWLRQQLAELFLQKRASRR